MALRFAYNTNGTSNHRLDDALDLIHDAGYQGVALTLDHHHFDPFAEEFEERAGRLTRRLETLRLGLVVETGARFLLDPFNKHSPTLLCEEAEGRARRVCFLKAAIDLAAAAGAEAVSFWAGVRPSTVSVEQAHTFLREGLEQVLDYAGERNVPMALEPEPGMLVEKISEFHNLQRDFPSLLLALDTGHCLATGECEPEDAIDLMSPSLGTVAIEDMRRGVHEHLFFGEGEMNLPAVIAALGEIDFQKLVCVELSRDSHRADTIVPKAIEYLRRIERRGGEVDVHASAVGTAPSLRATQGALHE